MTRLSLVTGIIICCILCHCAAFGASKSRDNYNEALIALKRGNTSLALELLSQAINNNPSNHLLYNDRGVAFKRLGDLSKAISDYTKALDIKPDYLNALNNRGAAYVEAGDYDKAIKDFTEALKYGNLQGKVNANLGIALALRGDHPKAVEEFEKAVGMRSMDAKSFLTMGESLENMGEKERALKAYKQALSLNSDPALAAPLKNKISSLASKPPNVPPRNNSNPAGQGTAAQPTQSAEKIETRQILPAQPQMAKQEIKEQPKSAEPQIESLEALENASRAKLLEKLGPASVEIYKQGRQFVQQSDLVKALIRFEDVLQLERRNKNAFAVGLCLLEIGRVYTKMGDHAKASATLDEALKSFERIGAVGESLLVFAELAVNKKNLGQAEKAQALLTKAVQMARAKGQTKLAKSFEDLANGRPVAVVKPAGTENKAEDRKSALKWGTPKPAQSTALPLEPAKKETKKPESEPPKVLEASAPKQQTNPSAVVASSEKERPVRIQLENRAPQATEKQPLNQNVAQASAPAAQKTTLPSAPEIPVGTLKPAGSDSAILATPNSTSMAGVGLGPAAWTSGDPKAKEVSTVKPASPVQENKTSAGDQVKAPELDTPKAPNGPTARPKGAYSKAIAKDLTDLRKYRESNNETAMITLLEKLADRYSRAKDLDKAQYALAAALAFREKLEIYGGLESVFKKSGFIKEQAGDLSGAIEDFSRAAAIMKEKTTEKEIAESEDEAKKLAGALGVDGNSLIQGFHQLWKARVTGENEVETEALYHIARVYDRANRPNEALVYYERSAASMMADKARVYEKMGKGEQAQQAYEQAMESFKKYDYPKYLDMKKKRQGAKKASAEVLPKPSN